MPSNVILNKLIKDFTVNRQPAQHDIEILQIFTFVEKMMCLLLISTLESAIGSICMDR